MKSSKFVSCIRIAFYKQIGKMMAVRKGLAIFHQMLILRASWDLLVQLDFGFVYQKHLLQVKEELIAQVFSE